MNIIEEYKNGKRDFFGANLRDANLSKGHWVIQGMQRSDGYSFLLTNFKNEGIRVKAGCRNFTLKQAKEHWEKTRKGTPLGEETFVIINSMVALAKLRGYEYKK